MAIRTAITGLAHGFQRSAMTAIASHFDMRAVQCKIRLYVVIEQPQIPGNGVVAGLTVTLEHAVVIVFVKMTVDAGAAGICEDLCRMAVVTFDVRVLA